MQQDRNQNGLWNERTTAARPLPSFWLKMALNLRQYTRYREERISRPVFVNHGHRSDINEIITNKIRPVLNSLLKELAQQFPTCELLI
jgi:hypothetical protein